MKGVPTKANKLFDPRNEVLKEIFGDEPDAFPPGEFGEQPWLDVLVDIGLRNKLDRDTILQCAKKVEWSTNTYVWFTYRRDVPVARCRIAPPPVVWFVFF